MNIDLLPFSAFMLESSGAAAQATRDAGTLTVPPDLVPTHAALEPAMGGIASVDAALCAAASPLRTAVAPTGGVALTITF